MSDLPSNLKYTKTHEWIREEGDSTASVGITHHAQELLGDLVFVELPEIGRQVSAGSDCAVVESVKAASDIYSPVTGEIVAINESLTDSPEIMNESPFEKGWIFKIRMENPSELAGLLDAEAYAQVMADDEH